MSKKSKSGGISLKDAVEEIVKKYGFTLADVKDVKVNMPDITIYLNNGTHIDVDINLPPENIH